MGDNKFGSAKLLGVSGVLSKSRTYAGLAEHLCESPEQRNAARAVVELLDSVLNVFCDRLIAHPENET